MDTLLLFILIQFSIDRGLSVSTLCLFHSLTRSTSPFMLVRTSLKNTLLLQLLLAIMSALYVHSFVPIAPSSSLRAEYTTQLQALASPPAEEEKNKKQKENDWTPTRGGFLPNLGKRPLIQQVLTLEDYKTVVVDEDERMVVVRFYAPWCRACKAVAPLYKRLAREYSPSIKFIEVPLTKQNAFLHNGLGIPKLPFGHIYYPTVGLVEELSINKRTFQDFRRILETYIDGSCDIPEEDFQ